MMAKGHEEARSRWSRDNYRTHIWATRISISTVFPHLPAISQDSTYSNHPEPYSTKRKKSIHPMSFYLLATIFLLLLYQTVNIVLIIRLLLQDFARAIYHFHTHLLSSRRACYPRIYILPRAFTATQRICDMATRSYNTILLAASKLTTSARGLRDPVKACLLSLLKRIKATLSTASDSPGLVQCAGHTEKGRCGREKRIVGSGVWYCPQHVWQGNGVEGLVCMLSDLSLGSTGNV